MRRVGILGGSFDPVHAAHLALARAAADTFALDEVRLMPCAQQALKRRRPAPAEDRCALLRLALGGDPRLTLDCRELWRRGKVYTIDTILELRAELPGAELWFILGMDAGALGRRARWLGAPGGRSGPKPRTGSRHPHGSAGDGGRLHQPRPRLAHHGRLPLRLQLRWGAKPVHPLPQRRGAARFRDRRAHAGPQCLHRMHRRAEQSRHWAAPSMERGHPLRSDQDRWPPLCAGSRQRRDGPWLGGRHAGALEL